MKTLKKKIISALTILSVGTISFAAQSTMSKQLELISNNQKQMIYNQNVANSSLNKDVLTIGFDDIENINSSGGEAEFIQDYNSKSDEDKKMYGKNLNLNSYIMNLINNTHYKNESSVPNIFAGATVNANVIANAVLSKINSDQTISENIEKSVNQQASSDWMDGLKSSTRDQLLRSISVQLSIANLISYQQLQAQHLDTLMKVAQLYDNGALAEKLDNNSVSVNKLIKQLNNTNNKLLSAVKEQNQ